MKIRQLTSISGYTQENIVSIKVLSLKPFNGVAIFPVIGSGAHWNFAG